MAAAESDRPTIVFVHGMYLTGESWDPWVARAKAHGYRCLAPSWPFHAGSPVELRARIDPGLGRLTFGAVTDHLKAFLDGVDDPVVLVGHSIGGLLVQKLVNDGYGIAGAAISSAPPRGILSFDPHFYRANFPHVNPFAGARPVIMTPERFHYTFGTTMSAQASRDAFQRWVVPESRNVPRSTLTSQGAIDWRRPHVPLLFVAGDTDRLTPASMVRRNARAYPPEAGAVEVVEFAHRSHLICNQDGWEEVADHVLGWIDTVTG